MGLVLGAQGVNAGLRGQATNVYELEAGNVKLIPAGAWFVSCGKYTTIQQYDPITTIWRAIGDDTMTMKYVNSDGVNFRLANQTGCVVGAVITNAGSAYTSNPTVTATGGAVFLPIIGGALNTSITVANGGTNYTYPPNISFDAPPVPGIQATGYATISAGAITSITVTDQGAGYTAAPNVYIQNDPRDTTGAGGVATCVLTGAGTLTGLLVTDHGLPQTSVPSITITGGGGSSAAATALMCWSITSYTVSVAGSGYVGGVEITGIGGSPTNGTGTNPTTQQKLVRKRRAWIVGALSGVGITATGQVVEDGGIYDAAPTAIIVTSPVATLTTAATIALVMGGQNDRSLLFAA